MKLNSKDGLKAAVPIMIGYFPVAMAFGILSKSSGLNFMETAAFSVILFAGASQFIGVSMLMLGAGLGEIVLTTLLLNFRHFFMSASLVSKLGHINRGLKPVLGFFVTDEIFSVASFAEGEISDRYLLILEITSYSSWVAGTMVGFLIGNILPPLLQLSMGIGLYALFASILIPELKKSSKALVLASLAGAFNMFLRLMVKLPQGWSIVITIVVISALGVVIYREDADE